MRPSRLFLTLAVLLVFVTCVVALTPLNGGTILAASWGLLVGAGLLDLLMSRKGRSVSVAADLPAQVFVGTSTNAKFSLISKSGNLPAGVDLLIDTSEGLEAGYFEYDLNATEANFDLPIICSKRGTFEFKQVWLSWPSRFGLFDIISRQLFGETIQGVPNIQPVLSGQITTQVQAELYGVKNTASRGEGSEFHQLRDFISGMDPRMIDWKRSARHHGLVARETKVEQNHQIIMCVDNGYLMREEIEGLPKIDRAINAALATTWAAGLGGDRVGFFSFDSRPRLFLPPEPGRQAFTRIRYEAAALKYSSVESNHTLALAHLNGVVTRRSLIIVFSDFVDSITAELLVENMAVLSRHHVLIFVALRDPALDALASPENPSLDDIAAAVSAAQIRREREIVLDQLNRLGVVCLDIAPNQLTPELVSTYLDIKSRELI